jgi:hypothetical protein
MERTGLDITNTGGYFHPIAGVTLQSVYSGLGIIGNGLHSCGASALQGVIDLTASVYGLVGGAFSSAADFISGAVQSIQAMYQSSMMDEVEELVKEGSLQTAFEKENYAAVKILCEKRYEKEKTPMPWQEFETAAGHFPDTGASAESIRAVLILHGMSPLVVTAPPPSAANNQ